MIGLLTALIIYVSPPLAIEWDDTLARFKPKHGQRRKDYVSCLSRRAKELKGLK